MSVSAFLTPLNRFLVIVVLHQHQHLFLSCGLPWAVTCWRTPQSVPIPQWPVVRYYHHKTTMDFTSLGSPIKTPSPIEISSNLASCLSPPSWGCSLPWRVVAVVFVIISPPILLCNLIIQSDLVARSESSCLVLLIGLSLAEAPASKLLFLLSGQTESFFLLLWAHFHTTLLSFLCIPMCKLQHHFPSTDLLLLYVKFPYLCHREVGVRP